MLYDDSQIYISNTYISDRTAAVLGETWIRYSYCSSVYM